MSWQYSLSDIKKTGLQLVAVQDSASGVTLRTALANTQQQVPATMAFAGARYSRSALSAEELFAEIQGGKKSAQEKLAAIFVNYGHASVGDMAMLFAYLENVPRYVLMQFFASTALGGGQERSTRYQDFSQAKPPNWDWYRGETSSKEWQVIKKRADSNFNDLLADYRSLMEPTKEALAGVFKPEEGNKGQESAWQARSFDVARALLPLGMTTSGAYIVSAREWARLIQVFRSSEHRDLQVVGEGLQALFAPDPAVQAEIGYSPEAPDLIRHTEPSQVEREWLASLAAAADDLLASVRSGRPRRNPQSQSVHVRSELDSTTWPLFAALSVINPQLTVEQFTRWFAGLSTYRHKKISEILFHGFTHHQQLPIWTHHAGLTLELHATVSEIIDLNRHRSCGRLGLLTQTANPSSLLRDGYLLPMYLDHPKLKKLRAKYIAALDRHYAAVQKLADQLPSTVSPRLLLGLLPNAHHVRYYLSGGVKELHYLANLRVRPGGHINYRWLAYEVARQVSKHAPHLSGIALSQEQKPDPFSREQFFNRS